jgi:hypothetical protein
MTWVDWAIVILMALSVLGGASAGVFPLRLLAGRPAAGPGAGGLELRFRVAALLMPLVRIERWPMPSASC